MKGGLNVLEKRPVWMIDYEVTEIDQSENPLTYFALFFFIVILQFLMRLSKIKSGRRQWMKKLQLLNETIHRS